MDKIVIDIGYRYDNFRKVVDWLNENGKITSRVYDKAIRESSRENGKVYFGTQRIKQIELPISEDEMGDEFKTFLKDNNLGWRKT